MGPHVPRAGPDERRRAGPPTVADVDGDGQLEIAVAGSSYLTVFETDGSVKWRVPAADSTPNVGTAAFDFDGDGAAELVYADENDLRLFRGRDGVVLFRDVNGSVDRVGLAWWWPTWTATARPRSSPVTDARFAPEIASGRAGLR